MHKDALLLIEHLVGKEQHLLCRFVEIFFIAGQLAHLGDRGNAHEHIVEPKRVWLRAVPPEGPVRKPVLAGHYMIQPALKDRLDVSLAPRTFCLDHRRRHRTGIIERPWV